MELSFFGNNRSTGEIRAIQVANWMKAKLNPVSGYEDDICIYVKQVPQPPFPKNSYMDVLDGFALVDWLKNYPEMGVIAFTKISQQRLSERLGRSDIKLIPQHHCNFSRRRRRSKEVKTVGFIGSIRSFPYDFSWATEEFKKVGLNFIYKLRPRTRRAVVAFYSSIDIQVCHRPRLRLFHFKDSLKLANAGSFGIPTVTFPEPNNVLEFQDAFVPANTIEEVIEGCRRLRDDPEYYETIALNALSKSEDYHIENIVKFYDELRRR